MTIPRPAASEYPPHFEDYVSRVPPGDVLERLQGQLEELLTLLGGLSDEEARFRYAPDKWSIKQIIGHLSDTERIMSYRGLCAARSETTGLPSFDENAYVAAASFDARPLADLLAELATVRAATVSLFRGLTPEELLRRGTASGREYTSRAMAYMIVGHEIHHVRVLRERYLPGLPRFSARRSTQ